MRTLTLLLLLCAILSSCTVYHSQSNDSSISFASVGTNYGILTDEDREGSSNAGFGTGGSSLLGVGSKVDQTESSQPTSITFADGTTITGTIDQTSSINSIGTTVARVVFINAWRKVFERMFDSIDNAVDADLAKNELDADVETRNIDAGVRETAILNPVEVIE